MKTKFVPFCTKRDKKFRMRENLFTKGIVICFMDNSSVNR